MHVVIMGCGRSGSTLAARLDAEGDSVSVVDPDPGATSRLPAGFKGKLFLGEGMRRAELEAAGIDQADAFVALTGDDSLNLVTCRLARDVFRVPHVVARVRDVERAPIGAELGLPMVAPVRMTVDRVHRMLRHRHLEPEHTFGDGELLLVRSPVPEYLAGRQFKELEVPGEIKVVEVTRNGHATIPSTEAVLKGGDVVSFVVASSSLRRLRGFLGGRWR